MSSFRRYGGLNYSANNNITKSYISNAEQMNINNHSGQLNSKETFASHIDMSGNSILHTGTIYFQDGTNMSTAQATGPQGATGAGFQGATGAGFQGATGIQGATGAQGATGHQAVQPYTQLVGGGGSEGLYTTSASGEVWGKNYNSGTTGYLITYSYAGYTPSTSAGWNSDNGFYYAPMNGVYSISISMYIFSDTLGNRYMLSHYNSAGTLLFKVYIHSALETSSIQKVVPYSIMLKMNAGDYFYVFLLKRNSTSQWLFGNNAGFSSMTITRVS